MDAPTQRCKMFYKAKVEFAEYIKLYVEFTLPGIAGGFSLR